MTIVSFIFIIFGEDLKRKVSFMKTIWTKVCLSIIILAALVSLAGCGDSRLAEAERLLETDVKAADSILSSMPMPTSRRDRAWYAVLKTQADYKQYKTITSDSLIITATDYFGTSIKGSKKRRYQSALAWYSQGSVYSELNNDFAAINAYLKAKDLFPDTLIRYYALTEQNLGNLYLNRMMIDEAEFQFRCCQINAERLQDVRMSNYSFFHRGLCALYRKSFLLADSIFKVISNNNIYTFYQRSVATMQLAKIYLYFYNDNANALNLINNYLDMIRDREYGPGLGIKAEIFYVMGEYDSAYYYFSESVNYCDEIYSKCSDADRLSELSSLKGNTEESIYWHKLYGELRDSINKIERNLEIEEIQFKHNEELVREMVAHKHRRFVIVGISTMMLLALSLFLFYSLYKNRERKKILKKQSDLLRQEEDIRKSSIKVLQARVSELSACNEDARSTLLDLYSNRLKICRDRFSKTDSFCKLLSFKLDTVTSNLSRKEKDDLFEELQLSYMESISDAVAEIPDIKEREILTILLRHQDLSIIQISNLFSLTPIAVKQRITRLSKRAPSDFLNLFFKSHI